MSAPIYDCSTEGAVALVAATAKTVAGVKAHANSGLLLVGYKVEFTGVVASEVSALVEIGYCTWATNSPGTNSTSTTPRQRSGRVLTAGFTAGKTWTAEPTVITSAHDFLLTPNAGTWMYDFLPGQEFDSALAEGFVMRITATATVSARAVLSVSRC